MKFKLPYKSICRSEMDCLQHLLDRLNLGGNPEITFDDLLKYAHELCQEQKIAIEKRLNFKLETIYFRVRQLLPSYRLRPGLVPENIYPEEVPDHSFPKWAYTMGPSNYGKFVESIIKAAVEVDGPVTWEGQLETIWKQLFSAKVLFDMKDKRTRGVLFKIYHFARKQLKPLMDGKTCQWNPEILAGPNVPLMGHPDLIIESNPNEIDIYDVKTSSKFKTMKEDTILQLLSYVAMSKAAGMTVKKMGVILPITGQILVWPCEDWDFTAFYQMIAECSLAAARMNSIKHLHLHQKRIGSHVGLQLTKKHRLYTSISAAANSFSNAPIQMFLTSPQRNTLMKFEDSDIVQTLDLITNLKIRYYTHAPYIINLSQDTAWALKNLAENLTITCAIGGQGVVVHTGQAKTLPIEEATENMYNNILSILDNATPECPLLLETPCGEGTEICTTLEEFIEFLKRFEGDPRLKVCVDTCHVFAAGYDPYQYLIKLTNALGPHIVKLIHFNDSKYHRCSRRDGHSPWQFENGYIGQVIMGNVSFISKKYSWDMVIE